jgi:hypothetical protein
MTESAQADRTIWDEVRRRLAQMQAAGARKTDPEA